MTRAEWTSGVLARAEREALGRELSKVLPYPEEAQRVFLDLVDEAIAEFEALRVPAAQDGVKRKARMTRLAKVAREFAESVADLDEDSGDLVEQSMWAVEEKGAEIPDFKAVRGAGKLAARVSEGAEQWINHDGPPRGHNTKAALDGLIGELGRSYLAAFRVRPSPVLNGPFAKSLTPIFKAARLDIRASDPSSKGEPALTLDEDASDTNHSDYVLISRTRLNRIIKTRVVGGTKLRSGRKPATK